MTQRPVSFGLRYAVRSDVGLGRNDNQDSAFGGAHLLAVADGMGGAVGGAVASSAAISAIEAYDDLPDDADLTEVLQTAVEAANHEIAEVIDRQPDLRGMGTTLTALLSDGEHLALGHVGDSRAYRAAADGTVGQISHDHSFVQALVDEGRITAEEALTHPWRSRILRALMGSEVAIDVDLLDVSIGDRYLICSDGLTDYVRAETVVEAMREGTPDEAAERLVALALRGGGGDNITVIVADIVAAAEEAPPAEPVLAGAIAGESESTVEPTSPAARAAITLPIKQRRPAPAPAHRGASDGSATDDDAVDADAAAPDDRAAHAHAAHADVAEDTATPAGADEDTGPDTAELARATDDRNAEAAGKRTDAAEHPPGRAGRRVGRYLALAAVIVLIAAGFGSYRWTQTQYVVRADDGTIVLDRGLNVSVGGMHLYRRVSGTGLTLTDLVPAARSQISGGITVSGRGAADDVVTNLRQNQLLPRCPRTGTGSNPSNPSNPSNAPGTPTTAARTPTPTATRASASPTASASARVTRTPHAPSPSTGRFARSTTSRRSATASAPRTTPTALGPSGGGTPNGYRNPANPRVSAHPYVSARLTPAPAAPPATTTTDRPVRGRDCR